MKDVKMRPVRDKPRIMYSIVKTPNRALKLVKANAKENLIRTAERRNSERSNNSPQQYAEQKSVETFAGTVNTVKDGFEVGVRKTVKTIRKSKEGKPNTNSNGKTYAREEVFNNVADNPNTEIPVRQNIQAVPQEKRQKIRQKPKQTVRTLNRSEGISAKPTPKTRKEVGKSDNHIIAQITKPPKSQGQKGRQNVSALAPKSERFETEFKRNTKTRYGTLPQRATHQKEPQIILLNKDRYIPAGDYTGRVSNSGLLNKDLPKSRNLITNGGNISAMPDKGIKAPKRGLIQKADGNAISARIKDTANKSVKAPKRIFKKLSKKSARLTVKSSRVAVKTAKHSLKTTTKAAKASAKAAQAAMRAAKAAQAAAKTAIKVLQAMIKTVIAGVKALISAIAAGGWVAVLIMVAIIVVVLLASCLLGVFFAEDQNGVSIKETIVETNGDFKLAIDTQVENLKTSAIGTYDKINVIYDGNMDGDGDLANNWRDVLIVFAASQMGNGDAPIELTDESKAELKHIFYLMNPVNYRTEVTTETPGGDEAGAESPDDEDEEELTVLNIYVTVDSKTWEEGAVLMNFNDSQKQIAKELAKHEYYSFFANLIGSGLVEDGNPQDVRRMVGEIPDGSENKGAVEAALTRIGDPYSQPKRGQGSYVDCSYFVWWAYNKIGKSMPTTSVEQAKYFVDAGLTVSQSELQPGDLVFWSKTTCGCGRWKEIHHVGMYIGDNKVIEASSSKGQVVVSKMWGLSGGKWQVYAFARP